MADIPEEKEKGGKTEDRKEGEEVGRRQDKEKGVRRKKEGGRRKQPVHKFDKHLTRVLYTLYTVHEMFFLCNLNIHLKAFKPISKRTS